MLPIQVGLDPQTGAPIYGGSGSASSGSIGGGAAIGRQSAQNTANQSGNDSTIQSNPDYQMNQFFASMMAPLDMNDPMIKSLMQGAQSSVMAGANASGIQGPMSINAGQHATIGQATNMQMQNAGQGLNALNSLSSNQLGYGNLGVNAQLGFGNLGLTGASNAMKQQEQNYEMDFNNQYMPWEIASGIGGAVTGAVLKAV